MTCRGLFSNAVIAGAIVALVTTLGGTAASADPFCERYAARAVEHVAQARANKCGFTGKKNWHSNTNKHFQFCLDVGQREAQTYERGRAQAIETCVASKKTGPVGTWKGPTPKAKSPGAATIRKPVAKGINTDWCGGWARNQVRLYNDFRKSGCTLSGDNSFGGLLEYCMTAPSRGAIINRRNARHKEGSACIKSRP